MEAGYNKNEISHKPLSDTWFGGEREEYNLLPVYK